MIWPWEVVGTVVPATQWLWFLLAPVFLLGWLLYAAWPWLTAKRAIFLAFIGCQLVVLAFIVDAAGRTGSGAPTASFP